MVKELSPLDKLHRILDSDPRFPIAAYHAVHKGLEFTLQLKKVQGHVTGQELAIGLAGYLRDEYGPFARLVLGGWNVRSTADFGALVFNLIDAGLMRKQDSDRLEDFRDVYRFDDAFGPAYDWLVEVRADWGLSAPRKNSSG